MKTADDEQGGDKQLADTEALPTQDEWSPQPNQDKLDMLNNITLDIRVEIGRANIKISEVLNLNKGMILELDQSVNEPLNIYANDKIIARGNIISANGRYCIKIL